MKPQTRGDETARLQCRHARVDMSFFRSLDDRKDMARRRSARLTDAQGFQLADGFPVEPTTPWTCVTVMAHYLEVRNCVSIKIIYT